jgi:hypothetical protein
VLPEIGGWQEQQVVQERKERKGRKDKRAFASHLLETEEMVDPNISSNHVYINTGKFAPVYRPICTQVGQEYEAIVLSCNFPHLQM